MFTKHGRVFVENIGSRVNVFLMWPDAEDESGERCMRIVLSEGDIPRC